ncbi:TonB-dependent receptor P3 [Arenibacter antarcticus]|uniref:TonB-dependent receptor n=1 Tax=Arenibacter antarcticus TaxID=2040469 RepID=A0ABW5VD59_9FLAO|nr:TonB-dependent receptor [Arenibacter sp. H213]MCM4169386.1 SusC/RagA family TonB-linked outer membrane protein [Arenibacter sp. H213]
MKNICFKGWGMPNPFKITLKMKITTLLLIVSLFKIQANSYSQNTKISINHDQIAIAEVFRNIESKSEFKFLYKNKEIDLTRKVSIHASKETIYNILNQLFKGTPIGYEVMDNRQIVLTKQHKNILKIVESVPIGMSIQQFTVNGIIQDDEGRPLSGANVVEAGTTNGVTADFDGNFTINVKSDKAILLVSYIGFATKEVPVNGRENLSIVLEESAAGLDEVVVVGYGKQKKESVVGAQSTLKRAELKSPVGDLTTAIAGKLAGVVATQRGGGPGADGATLFIRGIGTFASSPQTPLLVVDGVPDRDINNIDPEDIESFTILKDATATAVYGTRGANGVILINTRTGKKGKPTINVELNHAVTQFTSLPEFVDGPNFMRLYNEGLEVRGRSPLYTEETINKHESGEDPDLYPNTDWYDVLFNDYGSNDRVTVNINGGSENATYYLSTGYFGEVGQFKKDRIQAYNSELMLNRFNFTSNLNLKISKSTKLDFGVNGYITDYNRPAYGVNQIFSLASATAPHIIPPQYSNGEWPQLKGTLESPYMALTQSGVTNQSKNTIRSNLRISQELDILTKGLSATAMFAYDVNNSNYLTRSRSLQTYFANGRDDEGNLITEISSPGSKELGFSLNRYGDKRFYLEAAGNYSRRFGLHDVSAMTLFNQSDYRDASERVKSYKAAIQYRQRNFVGRANYGYADKYFAEANFSYSGSDNFVESERYGFFPSFGAGWIASKEKFFEPLEDLISHFKLRYSYGLSGNAAVNNPDLRFLYLTTIGEGGNYTFGAPGSQRNFKGYYESRVGGNVRWETSYRQNLGIELNFLNNNLELIVELFKEKREGILLPNYVIPYASGFTTGNIPYNNIGKTENKGIDVTAEYNKNWGTDNFFSFKGTFNYNENLAVFDGLPEWKYPYLNRIGQPISQRFGYIATGLFETEDEIGNAATQAGDIRPGDIRYKDLNGDGVINSNDQTAIGYGSIPKIVYGLSFGGGFKGFDISLFFQGTGLVDFNYSSGFATTPFPEGATYGNMYSMMLNRWTPENPNPDAFYPRLSTSRDVTTNYYTSTWWIKRADYLRLKQAEIGYSFTNNRFLNKYAIQKLRVFTSGTNLFTLTPWKHWDPELGDGRGAVYPNISTYNIGLRINFQ